MTFINADKYRFGFELEIHNVERSRCEEIAYHATEKIDGNYSNAQPYWSVVSDGDGQEFKTSEPIHCLDDHMRRTRELIKFLREAKASVSSKNEKNGGFYSPRGIHIHVSRSYPCYVSKDTKRHQRALNILFNSSYVGRHQFCQWGVSGGKYHAINMYGSDRIEIRAYNATLNIRGIAKMFSNAVAIGEVMLVEPSRGGNMRKHSLT